MHKSLHNKFSRYICLAYEISDESWFSSLSTQIAYFYNLLFSVKRMLDSKLSPQCTEKVLDLFSFYFTVSPRLNLYLKLLSAPLLKTPSQVSNRISYKDRYVIVLNLPETQSKNYLGINACNKTTELLCILPSMALPVHVLVSLEPLASYGFLSIPAILTLQFTF